jgi:lipoyl(octanoyl) transferase
MGSDGRRVQRRARAGNQYLAGQEVPAVRGIPLQHVCWLVDIGLTRYDAACKLQHELVEARKARAAPDVLLFAEHPSVITLGRNGRRDHLLAGNRLLAQMNVEFRPTDRGGDITYHGPGQVVGYPILDLTEHRRDVRWYVEQLERVMIAASADFGVPAQRVEGRHGIWVESASGEEKLAAIGVHLSRWVTSHGFAYNVSTDLRYFDLIVPCGIAGRRATSLERILGRSVGDSEVRKSLALRFGEIFQSELIPMSLSELTRAIGSASLKTRRRDEVSNEAEVLREMRT